MSEGGSRANQIKLCAATKENRAKWIQQVDAWMAVQGYPSKTLRSENGKAELTVEMLRNSKEATPDLLEALQQVLVFMSPEKLCGAVREQMRLFGKKEMVRKHKLKSLKAQRALLKDKGAIEKKDEEIKELQSVSSRQELALQLAERARSAQKGKTLPTGKQKRASQAAVMCARPKMTNTDRSAKWCAKACSVYSSRLLCK